MNGKVNTSPSCGKAGQSLPLPSTKCSRVCSSAGHPHIVRGLIRMFGVVMDRIMAPVNTAQAATETIAQGSPNV